MAGIYNNFSTVGPDTDPARAMAMTEAMTVGVQLNNEGNLARQQGQLDRALKLHLKALQLKIRGFGEESVEAALSYNTLGETYLALGAGKLDKAEEALQKALGVRNERMLGGLEMGPRPDAAVTRDNIARVLEARGKMGEARAMRMKGDAMGRIMCGSNGCVTPGGALRSAKDLQKCGACRAVFYCGVACQRKDWKARHKPLCQAYTATARGS